MKKFRLSLVVVLTSIIFLSACKNKKAPSHVSYIPADAPFVITLDTKKMLSESIELKDLFALDIFNLGSEKGSSIAKSLQNSGIDFLTKVYIFGEEVEGEPKPRVVFLLEDKDDFKKFLEKEDKDLEKEAMEVQKDGKISFVKGNDYMIGFDDKVGIFVGGDTSIDKLKALFDKQSGSLYDKNSDFKKSTESGTDIAMWGDLAKMSEGQMDNLSEKDLKDSYVTANIDFQKGKVVIDASANFNDKLAKKFENSVKDGISSKLLQNFSLENPKALIGLSLNLEEISKELEANDQLSQQTDDMLRSLNTNSKEFGDVFTGEIVLGVSTLGQMLNAEGIISLGIKDSKKFEAFADKSFQGMLQKGDNGVYEISQFGFLILKDDAVYLTLTPSIKRDIAKGGKALDGDYQKPLKENAGYVFLDFELLEQIPTYQGPKGDESPFKSLTISASPMKGKEAKLNAEIELKDDSKNPLKTLLEMKKEGFM